MAKAKNSISTLTPDQKVLIEKLNFYREHITCTKCAATNTLHHIEDDPANSTGKLKFQCVTPECPSKPSTVMIEREISNLEKSIPYIKTTTNAPKGASKIPKPQRSTASRRNLIKNSNSDETAIDENDEMTNTVNDDNVTNVHDTQNNPTANSSQINVLIDLVKSLQSRLTKMEIQLTNTNNKNAALHQQIAQLTKTLQLEDVSQNNATTEYMEEESLIEGDSAMQGVQFNKHGRSKSTPVFFRSSQESKWAHPYTPGQLNKEFNNKSNNTNSNKDNNSTQNNRKTNKTNKNSKNTKNSKKSYADMLKAQQKTEKLAKQHVKNVNIATRYFTEITPENEGFEYVYFPSKGRTGRKKMRKQLKTLGVSNGRVLDIHYPEKITIALLVHKMCRTELVQQLLQNGGIREKEHYDPTNPEILTNPEHVNLSKEEKSEIAKQMHQARIVRALPFIRAPASKAVAKQFVDQNIITEEQYNTFIEHTNKEQETKNNTTSSPNTVNNTTNSAQDEDAPMPGASPLSNSL